MLPTGNVLVLYGQWINALWEWRIRSGVSHYSNHSILMALAWVCSAVSFIFSLHTACHIIITNWTRVAKRAKDVAHDAVLDAHKQTDTETPLLRSSGDRWRQRRRRRRHWNLHALTVRCDLSEWLIGQWCRLRRESRALRGIATWQQWNRKCSLCALCIFNVTPPYSIPSPAHPSLSTLHICQAQRNCCADIAGGRGMQMVAQLSINISAFFELSIKNISIFFNTFKEEEAGETCLSWCYENIVICLCVSVVDPPVQMSTAAGQCSGIPARFINFVSLRK